AGADPAAQGRPPGAGGADPHRLRRRTEGVRGDAGRRLRVPGEAGGAGEDPQRGARGDGGRDGAGADHRAEVLELFPVGAGQAGGAAEGEPVGPVRGGAGGAVLRGQGAVQRRGGRGDVAGAPVGADAPAARLPEDGRERARGRGGARAPRGERDAVRFPGFAALLFSRAARGVRALPFRAAGDLVALAIIVISISTPAARADDLKVSRRKVVAR